MGKPAPAAPDYGAISAASDYAADKAASTASDQLAWAKDQYNQSSATQKQYWDQFMGFQKTEQDQNDAAVKKAQDQADQTIGIEKNVSDEQLKEAQQASANAVEDRDFYKSNYQPLEKQAIDDAETYDKFGRKDVMVGQAQSAVAQSFDQQRAGALKDLEGYGIDPSSTRFAALDIGLRASKAAAQAAAGTQMGLTVEDRARALRDDAINVGKGYASNVAGSYNIATGASAAAGNAGALGGQAANAAASTGFGSTAAGSGMYGAGTNLFGAGTQAAGVYGNLMGSAPTWGSLENSFMNTNISALNTGFQNRLDSYKAAQAGSSGLGSLAGLAGAVAMSSKFAEGGVVPVQASPSAGAIPDDVPARVQPLEFVVPRDTVLWKGEEFFQNVIDKSRKDRTRVTAKPQVGPQLPGPPAFRSPGAGGPPAGQAIPA